jgi:hypothetical protein
MSRVGVNEPAKEAAVLQALLKLQAKLPKKLAHFKLAFNCELGLAIALTKLNRLEEAQQFARKAVANLERELHLNLKIPIQDNVYTGASKAERHRYTKLMQSLCLALHHLGCVCMRLDQWDAAKTRLASAHALALKYLDDESLVAIIENDLNRAQKHKGRTPSSQIDDKAPAFVFSRTMRRSKQPVDQGLGLLRTRQKEKLSVSLSQSSALIQSTLQDVSGVLPNEQDLLREIFGSSTKNKRRKPQGFSTVSSRLITPKHFLAMPDFLSPRELTPDMTKGQPSPADALVSGASSTSRKDMPMSKRIVIKSVPQTPSKTSSKLIIESPKSQMMTIAKLREIEGKAAVCIQRHFRGFITRRRPVAKPKPTMVRVDVGPPSTRQPKLTTNDFIFLDPVELSEIQIITERPIVRTRASAKDYLSLEAPEIVLMKRLGQSVYQWTIKATNLRVDYALVFDLEMHGVLTNWTSSLLHKVSLSFDPSTVQDFRVMKPFQFATLWPIIVSALEDLEDNALGDRDRLSRSFLSKVGADMETDESAIEQLLFIAEQILERFSVSCSKLGEVLGPYHEEYTEESREELGGKEMGEFRYRKDGVVKNLFIYLKHLGFETQSDSSTQLKQLQRKLVGTILERGLIKLQRRPFFMTLSVGRGSLGSFESCALISLQDLNSNWDDQLSVAWDDIQAFFQGVGYFLHIPVLFHLQRMPAEARALFYEHLPEVLEIRSSSLHFASKVLMTTSAPDFSPRTEDIYVTSSRPAVRINEVDWVTGEQALNWSQLMPETVYTKDLDVAKYLSTVPEHEAILLLPTVKFNGEKDRLHLKFTKTDGGLTLVARAQTSEKSYAMRVRNTNVLAHLIRVCEQGVALSTAVLQSELLVRDQDNGKVLNFNITDSVKRQRRLRYRGVRVTCNESNLASVYICEDSWEVSLLVMRTGKTYVVHVNDADFKTHFGEFLHFTEQSQTSSVYSDMDLETLFYLPFIDKLTLLRTLLGEVLVWKPFNEDEAQKKAEGLSGAKSRSRVLRQLTTQEAQLSSKRGMLTYTEQELQVLLQRGKLVLGQEALLTVVRHSYIEEWRLIVHILGSGRQYVVRIYDSDLFNLTEDALSKHYDHPRHVVNCAAEAVNAWELILHECRFERNEQEMRFVFDRIAAPMREVLYMQYLTDPSQNIHYAEAFIKETLPDNFTGLKSLEEAREINLVLRAYSFEKRVWVKETMRLEEALMQLMKEQVLEEQVLIKRTVSYSELRRIAGQLLRVVKLSNRVKHVNKQKLLPDFSRISDSGEIDPFISGEWQHREPHSLSSIYEHDLMLYEEALPPYVAVIFFNSMLDEFIYVMYRPADGAVFRKHLAQKAVRKNVPHCDALLAESLYTLLGRRILYAFFDKVKIAVSDEN